LVCVCVGYSTPVQISPGAHPAFCPMGIMSFPAVKRPVCGVDHPPTSSDEIKERVELHLYSPCGNFMVCSRVDCTLE